MNNNGEADQCSWLGFRLPVWTPIAAAHGKAVVSTSAVNGNQNENNNVQSTVAQQATEIGIIAQNVVDQEGTQSTLDVKRDDSKATGSQAGILSGGSGQTAGIGANLPNATQTEAIAAIVSSGIQQVRSGFGMLLACYKASSFS